MKAYYHLSERADLSMGHKAANLSQLIQAGFSVPPGFVIVARENRELGLAAISDADLMTQIDQIGGWPVAVRSSATLEDLPSASSAGQFESFLNVTGLSDLRERINACWESGSSERVRAYYAQRKINAESNRVSVLVQKMIPAVRAGVGFSIHPLTGKEEESLLEVCMGLGEALVSGQITPSSFVVSNRTGEILSQKLGPEGASLSPSECKQFRELLLKVQAHFEQPQDVEWAIDPSGKIWLLQSRAVTQIAWRTDVEEVSNADLKDGGVSARACSPVMAAFYREATEASLPHYFKRIALGGKKETWISSYYGRVYFNAGAIKRRLALLPGYDEEKFDQDIGIQKSYGKAGPARTRFTPWSILRAIPVVLSLQTEYRRQLNLLGVFGGTFDQENSHWLRRSKEWFGVSDAEFWDDAYRVLTGFHFRTEVNYFTTIYNNSNLQTEFKILLEKVEKRLGEKVSVVDLIGGLADVSHLEIQASLIELCAVARKSGFRGFQGSEWKVALDRFLEKNYFHSDAELDLTVPRWCEIPERVEQLVRGILASGAELTDPVVSIRKQKEAALLKAEQIRNRLGQMGFRGKRLARTFLRELERVRLYLSHRERARQNSTQAYLIARLTLLEAGRRLVLRGDFNEKDDVFFLEPKEVLGLAQIAMGPELRELLEYRRILYKGYSQFTPPNEFGSALGGTTEKNEAHSGGVLQGIGCSAGVTEGLARVVYSLSEVGDVKKGEILVTRFTDPGWTPIMGLVSGIVTEVGGILSHAAVIGRELGVPTVLNLACATQAIQTGQRLRIDGTQGRVEILT